MKILVLGAAGFIGKNLAIKLSEFENNEITLVDRKLEYFDTLKEINLSNTEFKELNFDTDTDFDSILHDKEIVYHLISTTNVSNSNKKIAEEITDNVIATTKLLDACVRCKIKKVIFISSGGTVYGSNPNCPLNEDDQTYPISSYGLQKITIEKLLYLYKHTYGLNYKVIRLANPYGPYQSTNGTLGVITTFIYKSLKNDPIHIYGDGSIVRDFIYIDDAINGILNITNDESQFDTFNLGSGIGKSIKEILELIEDKLNMKPNIIFKPARLGDVPVNYLDISRYEKLYGKANLINLEEGIRRTAKYILLENNLQKNK